MRYMGTGRRRGPAPAHTACWGRPAQIRSGRGRMAGSISMAGNAVGNTSTGLTLHRPALHWGRGTHRTPPPPPPPCRAGPCHTCWLLSNAACWAMAAPLWSLSERSALMMATLRSRSASSAACSVSRSSCVRFSAASSPLARSLPCSSAWRGAGTAGQHRKWMEGQETQHWHWQT